MKLIQLFKKNRKILIFLSIFGIVFILINLKSSFGLKKKKIINNKQKFKTNLKNNSLKDSYLKFWNSVKIYNNNLNNSQSKIQKERDEVFSNINKILFNNNAVLLDPFIFTKITNIFKKEEIKKIYDQQDFNRDLIMSFVLEINHLSNFFKVNVDFYCKIF